MGSDVATLYAYNPRNQELVLAATRGLPRSGVGFVTLQCGEGVSGRAAAGCCPVSAEDVDSSPDFKVIPGFDQSRYRSILAVPVVHDGGVVGALNIQTVDPRAYDERDVRELAAMADAVSGDLGALWLQGDLAIRLRGPSLLSSLEGVIAASHGPREVCERLAAELRSLLPDSRVTLSVNVPGEGPAYFGDAPSPAAGAALADCLAFGSGSASDTAGIIVLNMPGRLGSAGAIAIEALTPGVPLWRREHVRHYVETMVAQVGHALERMQLRPVASAEPPEPRVDGLLQRELIDMVLSEAGLDALVARVTQACGSAVAVVDSSNALLAGAHPGSPGTPLALRSGATVLAYLRVEEAAAQSPELEGAAQAIALELAKWKVRFDVEAQLRGDILEMIIQGAITDERDLHARASLAGIDLRRPYVPVMLTFGDESMDPGPLGLRSLARSAARALGAPPECVPFVRPEGLLLLVAGEEPGGLAQPVRVALREYQTLGAERRVAAGIGPACRKPSEFGAAVRQAMMTANLSFRLASPEPLESVRLGIYQLLLAVSEGGQLADFVQDNLGPLIAHDQRGGGDLVKTLEAYHAAGERLRPAADALFVHVNTLKYRLARVEALTGKDLDSGVDRLNLYVALYALRLIAPNRESMLGHELPTQSLLVAHKAASSAGT